MTLVQNEPMGQLFICDQGHVREKHWDQQNGRVQLDLGQGG